VSYGVRIILRATPLYVNGGPPPEPGGSGMTDLRALEQMRRAVRVAQKRGRIRASDATKELAQIQLGIDALLRAPAVPVVAVVGEHFRITAPSEVESRRARRKAERRNRKKGRTRR
jgi:hypothetical protein